MTEEISKEEIQKRIELMKENCIFCKIVRKEIPSKIIFEDDICMAFLDINPSTVGNTILIPKEHYMMLPMMPDEVLGHLGVISKYIADLLKETFKAIDVTIMIANGTAAGQQVQHFSMNILPRYENDSININIEGNSLKDEDLYYLAEKLKKKLTNRHS